MTGGKTYGTAVIPETNRMVMEGFTFKEARNCVDTPQVDPIIRTAVRLK